MYVVHVVVFWRHWDGHSTILDEQGNLVLPPELSASDMLDKKVGPLWVYFFIRFFSNVTPWRYYNDIKNEHEVNNENIRDMFASEVFPGYGETIMSAELLAMFDYAIGYASCSTRNMEEADHEL